ncbi:hypothetical protein H6F43_04265 [Leptolyngbya sp. FACHB-36]|uniref:hypothetical protein n=1 Tax=Leptolyngbya sp. FACHB-36 TaxID=2692808 RepID=UPI001681B4D1|nr:hypothetical protein [Leptolyngbya sp. FACHB-36]MBD2019398.1 hypothetical protein [Leptolyngbya sp. FACHB-36]
MLDILTRYHNSVQAELLDNSDLQTSVIRAVYRAFSGPTIVALLGAEWEFNVDNLALTYDHEAQICHAANLGYLNEFARSLHSLTGIDCVVVSGEDGLWRISRQGDRWILESLLEEAA